MSEAHSSPSPSRKGLSANDLSMVMQGQKSMADVLVGLDLAAEVDRPEIVEVRCNIIDAQVFDVREMLGRIRQQQPRHYDWHVLKLLESPPDPLAPGERTVYRSMLRDFSDMAECSAICFGRNSVNDWIISNAHISRRHGIVVLSEQLEIWVFDGRDVDPSTNGLYFLDQRPPIEAMHQLTSEDEFVGFGPPIHFHDGHTGFLFHLRMRWIKQNTKRK